MNIGTAVRPRVRVVMFVEPRAGVRALYASSLRDSGFLVEEVTSIDEAVALAPRTRPDVLIVSRELSDGDGWDVARALKADEAMRQTPIVAFATHVERADVERALIAGCDSFVDAPCEPEALVRHVRGLLGMALDAIRTKAVDSV